MRLQKRISFLVVLLLVLSAGRRLCAQTSEYGIPYVQNFSPKIYQGSPQNFTILQDKRGVIFFGNKEGVFEYDGRKNAQAWNNIRLNFQSPAYALALDDSGTVYVGGNKEFGYLAPDSVGKLAYRTLTDKLPAEVADFGRIWTAHAVGGNIYFQADKILIRYQPQNKAYPIKIWRPKSNFFLTYKAFGKLFVHDLHAGLHVVEEDSLALAPEGMMLAGVRLYGITAYDSRRVLTATRDMGFFLYDGKKFEPFATEIDGFVSEEGKQLHHVALLPDSTFAISTLKGGVIIMDRAGHVRQIIDKRSGLLNQEVYVTYSDSEGGLWLGLGVGLARVETPGLLTRLNENYGLNGVATSVIRYKERLFCATSQGVFVAYSKTPVPALPPYKTLSFRPIENIYSECLAFLVSNGSLLAAGKEGVFEIKDEKAHLLYPSYARCLVASQSDSSVIYVGLEDGVAAFKHENNQWRPLGQTINIPKETRSLAEAPDGKLWAATNNDGVWVIDFSKGFDLKPEFIQHSLGSHSDLPSDNLNVVSLVGKEIVVATQGGLKIYNAAKNQKKFVPYLKFGTVLAGAEQIVYKMTADPMGQIWIVAKSYIPGRRAALQHLYRAVPHADSLFLLEKVPSERFLDFEVAAFYPEADGALWLGGDEELMRYETQSNKNFKAKFYCLIRNVVNPEHGSDLATKIIFGGVRSSLMETPVKFPFSENSFRFEYAAVALDGAEANEYQYWLEGWDKKWSQWSKESVKEYSNLNGGFYRFHVRARNIYGVISEEDVFEFKIRHPWYFRWWAFGLYIGLLGGVVYGAVSLRSRQLRKENQRLEEEVLKRTAKIEEQKEELSQKNTQLESQNDVLEEQKDALGKQKSLLEEQNEQLEHQKEELAAINAVLGDKNDLLETRKQEIELKQIALEQAYEELQITAEQLNDANISLTRTNIELEHKNDQIVKQQAQIILSEKMGALGEITPVVAHEINTPLGAVKASIQVMQTIVPQILRRIPELVQRLSPKEQETLWHVLDSLKNAAPSLSTREERKAIIRLELELSKAGVDNAEEFAEKFAKIGLTSGIQPLAHILNSPRAEDVVDTFHQVGLLWKQITTILNSADKALRIVEQLTKYVEPDKSHPTHTNVVDQIQSVLTLHDYYLRQGINLTTDLHLTPDVNGFQQELTQVWKNIIMDAAYAMNLKGNLEISAEAKDGFVVVRIADDGPPLTAEQLARIFEPGHAPRAVNKKYSEGKSLSACKNIIEKHNGSIQAFSSAGKTEFIVSLPVAPPED